MKKYNIAIVDDHILIAKALTSIIEGFPKFNVLYEVENGAAMIERFNDHGPLPDIVLLDVSMPVMNGFETAAWLKEKHPNVLVLALSMQDSDENILKMIKCGAKGYLLKNVHPSELEKALSTLIEKGFYYSELVSSKLVNNFTHDEVPSKAPSIKLNDREIEFLKYVCTEMTYKEIADKMFLSPRTVEGYRDSLFEKLNVNSRVGIALYAIKNGYYKL